MFSLYTYFGFLTVHHHDNIIFTIAQHSVVCNVINDCMMCCEIFSPLESYQDGICYYIRIFSEEQLYACIHVWVCACMCMLHCYIHQCIITGNSHYSKLLTDSMWQATLNISHQHIWHSHDGTLFQTEYITLLVLFLLTYALSGEARVVWPPKCSLIKSINKLKCLKVIIRSTVNLIAWYAKYFMHL